MDEILILGKWKLGELGRSVMKSGREDEAYYEDERTEEEIKEE